MEPAQFAETITMPDSDVAQRALDTLLRDQRLSGTAAIQGGSALLKTRFATADAAAAALAATGVAAATLHARRYGTLPRVTVDRRHAEASLLSFALQRFLDPARAPEQRLAPEQRTAVAGFYPARDGRIVYLHAGFPHNTRGLLALLDVADDRDAVAAAVARRTGIELEDAIADAGLCGAMVREASEWDACEAGIALAARPVVDVMQVGDSQPIPLPQGGDRPLSGVRVLDLTRVLAGPTCARTLAMYGADALRIGAEYLPSIPLFVADTGLGKRSAFVDLKTQPGRDALRRLIGDTDVFSQGYRSGALDRLGFGVTDVVRAKPGIVYVSINCYGHDGAWRTRPGWEQLAQTVTGIAHAHGVDVHGDGDRPELLPAAVTDYTTGYLAAYGVMAALLQRAERGGSYWVRVSLARTAMWVRSLGRAPALPDTVALSDHELAAMRKRIDTAWGPLEHLGPAVTLRGVAVDWRTPPVPLGTHAPAFPIQQPP
jgi:crotonobetainyl-CoA:carnitine CoA-transferase CaiB-like acyl-CoA transferase